MCQVSAFIYQGDFLTRVSFRLGEMKKNTYLKFDVFLNVLRNNYQYQSPLILYIENPKKKK